MSSDTATTANSESSPESAMQQARRIVDGLFTPSPRIYWTDFLITSAVAYSCALLFLNTPGLTASRILGYFVAGFALFRLALFMHELVHFRRGQMVAFQIAWNLTAGVTLLIPSFLYDSHIAHHNTHHYGTGNDGEYLPLGVGPLRNIFGFLGQILFLPVFVLVRFLIIAPVSFLHPKLRQFVLERLSSFVLNFSYRRAIPENAPRKVWAAMEVLCFLRAAALVGSVLGGLVPWTRLIDVYLLALLALGLNHLRTLVAHRYLSSGETMSHAEQVGDSINITGSPVLTELFFPVGLRYHALHHAFPSLPYHNLGIAHRRLVAQLPADSPYHRTNMRSVREALRELIKSSRDACAHPPPPADSWYARRKAMRTRPLAQLYGSEDEDVDAPAESSPTHPQAQ